jgi:hypothetical protein
MSSKEAWETKRETMRGNAKREEIMLDPPMQRNRCGRCWHASSGSKCTPCQRYHSCWFYRSSLEEVGCRRRRRTGVPPDPNSWVYICVERIARMLCQPSL